MTAELTSKERIIRTMEWKDVDYIPLALSGIGHSTVVDLNNKMNNDPFKAADCLLELGADAGLYVELPQALPPDVSVDYATRRVLGEKDRILTKTYTTPRGRLTQAVRRNKDYPFDEIDLLTHRNDHLVPPKRSYKYMIDCAKELDVLAYILGKPEDAAFDGVRAFVKEAKQYAKRKGIILTGRTEGVGDPLQWLSGVENIVFMSADEPQALHRYTEIISEWNIHRMRLLIDLGVDTVLRRGWYESTDFWSPAMYREFLLPALKKEAELAHSAGVKYIYIMNTGVDALADMIMEAEVDMQTNAEPEMCDIARLRKSFQNKVAMCTGVNNYHVLEECGEEQINEAVRYAIENYADGGGFILSPSDSIGGFGLHKGIVSEKLLRNMVHMVEAWKKYR